jgi:PAS domain S-box-containing protein
MLWGAAAVLAVTIALVAGLFFARQITTALSMAAEATAAFGRGEEFPLTGSRLKEADTFLVTLRNARYAREELTEEVKESRDWLQTTMSSIGDAVITTDATGIVTYLNPVAEELTGWPASGAVGKPLGNVFRIVNEDSRGAVDDPMAKVLAQGLVRRLAENTVLIARDGRELAIDDSAAPIRNGHGDVIGMVLIFRDITEQRQTERDRALRLFSVRLLRAQDEERRTIARELHDSVGQYLVHAKMSLESFVKNPDGTRALSNIVDSLDKCLTETRTISHLLHPPLLDDLGFDSAARLYVDGFSQRCGIHVNLNFPRGLKRLQSALDLVLFRVLQESLTNVHRHSQSGSVDVGVELDGDYITLAVKDHGKGMPPELLQKLKAGAGGGVGMNGMRERTIQFGGNFKIESDEHGTMVRASLPLSGNIRANAGASASPSRERGSGRAEPQ